MEDLLKQILNKLNQMEETQKQMQSDIKGLKENQKEMQSDIKDLKNGQSETNERLTRIESKLDDLEPKNATRHTEILSKIYELKNDVDFITHKENQTEKEVFTIKKKLEIIK